MDERNYLRQLGVWEVTIKDVTKKEQSVYKGKTFPPKIVVVFEDKKGRLIDANYKLPLEQNKWDAQKLKDLMAIFKAEKMSELKGKELAIIVSPRTWEGRLYWSVSGTFDKSYLLGEEAKLDAALGDMDDLFQGAKITKASGVDDLPF